ncbi:hypothetical protein PoB_006055500 [Plakobranchus ocellatus]|uniref:Uncharacterized protein n=1 Tax=Plakobranchus ocellatus TaxID=259542 RepID=A0AAV4CQ75_9GAST|nr:hypothetical protein PoB_006055500 [Plakobranchus ocellatus]
MTIASLLIDSEFDLDRDYSWSESEVRAIRKEMPKDLNAMTFLPQVDVAFRQRGQLVAHRWQDKKFVSLFTTIHDPTEKMNVRTRTGEK